MHINHYRPRVSPSCFCVCQHICWYIYWCKSHQSDKLRKTLSILLGSLSRDDVHFNRFNRCNHLVFSVSSIDCAATSQQCKITRLKWLNEQVESYHSVKTWPSAVKMPFCHGLILAPVVLAQSKWLAQPIALPLGRKPEQLRLKA